MISRAPMRYLRRYGTFRNRQLMTRWSFGSVPSPTGLAPLLSRIEVAAVARLVVVEIAAHAGSGVAWCQLAAPGDVPALSLFAEWLRVCTHEHHGWAIFERFPLHAQPDRSVGISRGDPAIDGTGQEDPRSRVRI